MLYLLLIKFALFLLLCAWLTRRNNLTIKSWSDEQLISSLPHYQQLKRQTGDNSLTAKFFDIDNRITQIKAETSARFERMPLKISRMNKTNRQALVRKIKYKRQQAKLKGNSFAHQLLEKQLEKIAVYRS